jgi:hypothetical protein
VVKHYSAAVQEFSNVFLELDKAKANNAPMVDHEKLEDDLETWLNDMYMEDGTIEPALRCDSDSETKLKINFEHVTLYRCSWCGNPSAILRKCGCWLLRITFVLTYSYSSQAADALRRGKDIM